MIPAQSVNYGNGKDLKWSLGRDCTAVTEARIRIAKNVGDTAIIDEVVTFVGPKSDGIIKWTTTAAHFGTGKLQIGEWRIKIHTVPGPLTHPDDPDEPYGRLVVLPIINPAP